MRNPGEEWDAVKNMASDVLAHKLDICLEVAIAIQEVMDGTPEIIKLHLNQEYKWRMEKVA